MVHQVKLLALVTFLILMHSFHISQTPVGVGVLTTVVSGGVSEILLLHNYVSKKNLLLK